MTIKKSNINRLKALISSRSPTKTQQEGVVRDYEQRKIANYLTAENTILKLQSSNKKVVEKALREILKYEDAEPVTGRLSRQTEIIRKRVRTKMSDEEVNVKRLNEEEENKKVNLRINNKKTLEAVNKIAKTFRKFNQPRLTYKSLDKAMTSVEISVEHLKKEEKDINKFVGSLEEMISAAR